MAKKETVDVFIFWNKKGKWRWSFWQNCVETELTSWKHYSSSGYAKRHAKSYIKKYMNNSANYIYRVCGYQADGDPDYR